MRRAKAIRAKQKHRRTQNKNTFGLEMYINSVYKRYTDLCYVSGEKPRTKGKWLFEEIEEIKEIENESKSNPKSN